MCKAIARTQWHMAKLLQLADDETIFPKLGRWITFLCPSSLEATKGLVPTMTNLKTAVPGNPNPSALGPRETQWIKSTNWTNLCRAYDCDNGNSPRP